MSGDARITGRIRITPPVTWGELHDKPWATGQQRDHYPDVVVQLDTVTETTSAGEFKFHSGVAIVPTGNETSAYDLADEVTRIAQTFGLAPDGTRRRFVGFLHVVWGGGEEVYRVVVREFRAVDLRPALVWPDGARDTDAAR